MNKSEPFEKESHVEDRVAELEAVVCVLSAEKQSLQEANQDASRMLSTIEEQRENLVQMIDRLASVNALSAELLAELEEKNLALGETNQQVARANAHAAELMAEIEIKNQQIETLNNALAEANARGAELMAQLEERGSELEQEIAERRRTGERLQKAKQEAEAATKAKSELLATMKQVNQSLAGANARAAELVAELEENKTKLEEEITERNQAEKEVRVLNETLEERVRERTAELQRAYDEMKELDKLKDRFLSSVSHEFRTPLTSIRSFTEILLNCDNVDEQERREFLTVVKTESERLTRLIDGVLEFSKVAAGKFIWNDDLVSLEETVRKATVVLKPFVQRKDLRLIIDVPNGLPPAFVDRDRIHQVIINLLSNAVKFSPEGGEIRIWAELLQNRRSGDMSDWLKMSISDQGTGIAEKDLDKIFNRFNQGSCDMLTEKPEGIGLGLPISKEIVAHYGGSIWVDSEKGKGSTFFFTLPTAAVSDRVSKNSAPVENKMPL